MNKYLKPQTDSFIDDDAVDDGSFMFNIGAFDVSVYPRTHQVVFQVDSSKFPNRDAFRAAKDEFRATLKSKLPPGPWTITQEPSL